MSDRVILLVEDNANDEALTQRALKKANIVNRVVVARDGAQALDYLFARGDFAARDPGEVPQVILLDLNLPKVGGLDVLRAIRADTRTGPGPSRRIQPRRQQLCRKAGGLLAVFRSRAAARALLAGLERATSNLGGLDTRPRVKAHDVGDSTDDHIANRLLQRRVQDKTIACANALHGFEQRQCTDPI
jgi:CheY-like chemotaxis protein